MDASKYFLRITMKNSSRHALYLMNPGDEIYLPYYSFKRIIPSFKLSDDYIIVQLKYINKHDPPNANCIDDDNYDRTGMMLDF